MDCLRAVSDGMVSAECRHTNFNSHAQIQGCQYNSSANTHFRLSEPLKPLCGTLELRGTVFQKQWSRWKMM